MEEVSSLDIKKPVVKKSGKTIIFIIAVILLILIIGGFAYYKMTGFALKENPKILIETSEGNIKVELYPDKAPETLNNFLDYVKSGTYEGTVFHRVIKDFMIQGGGYTETGEEKPTNPPIPLESNNGLKNTIGTIAMARTNVPDSATNQFFINTADNDFLDFAPGNDGYAVFGKVIEGMDIVKKIELSKTGVKNGMKDWPLNDIIIKKITLLN